MRLLIGILLILINASIYAANFSFYSPAIQNKQTIPNLFTCDGENISPELVWKNAPPNVQAFAIILHCPDAPRGMFYNWVVYNIPAEITYLKQGANETLPQTAMMGLTSIGDPIYRGPCPPDSKKHRYVFTIYALDTMLMLPDNSDFPDVLREIRRHTLDQAEFFGYFQHK